MITIPFLDLKQQYNNIKPEIDEAIGRVVNSQFFVLGPELEAFEKEFARYLGCKYVVGVNSGTDGLKLALLALGVEKGDEVITTPFSFVATTLAITEAGATPVFVDIDPLTYNIDPAGIEKKITSRTKAILPVHLYGAPCDMEAIMAIARGHKLAVVEDACQAHGAKIKTRFAGAFGDVGVFSFYPGKNLGAYGDGGAVCTDNENLYQKLLALRNYGQRVKYHHDTLGVNSRLDELQAAVLRVKLKYLDRWNAGRNLLASRYREGLKRYKVQKIRADDFSCYHLFVLESERRQELIKYLEEHGAQTLIHYPIPIHLQKCYKYLGLRVGDFPESEKAANRVISLPMYPELDKKLQDDVIKLLNAF